jgi:hypothetical protein
MEPMIPSTGLSRGRGSKLRGAAVVSAFVLMMSLATTSSPAAAGGKSNAYQHRFSDLTAQWWQWVNAIPVSDNPLFDTTGENANQDQSGHIFFLAGAITFTLDGFPELDVDVDRTISVPRGTAFFFPIVNSAFDNIGVEPPLTPDQLRELAAVSIDNVSELHVSVDGKSVPQSQLLKQRVTSPVYTYFLPEADNVVNFFIDLFQLGIPHMSGDISPAVSDGYWMYVNPLPPGKHTINFGGTSGDLKLNITYHITVTKK